MREIKISDYVFCNYLNEETNAPTRDDCLEEGIPLYVHIIINVDSYKKRRMCFGIRLPEEEISANILVLKTVNKDSFTNGANPIGDEVLQSMTENEDCPPLLTITMGKSLTQALDAAMGILKGHVLKYEISSDYPLGGN